MERPPKLEGLKKRGLTMKRLLLTTGLMCLAPLLAFGAHAQTVPPPDQTKEETNADGAGILSSSGLSQRSSLQGVYAKESGVKLNTVYLKGSSAFGIYARQISRLDNVAIINSNVDINRIAVHSGEISSSIINQSTYINGADIQNTSLELNRLVLN